MRRHRDLAVLVVVLFLVATVMLVVREKSPPQPMAAQAATSDTFEIGGVRLGMSSQEVEAVAGRAPQHKDCGDGTPPAWVYRTRGQGNHAVGFVAFDREGHARMVNGSALWKNGQVLFDEKTSREDLDAVLGPPVHEGRPGHRSRHANLVYELPSQDLRLLVFTGGCSDRRVFEISHLHDASGRKFSKHRDHHRPGRAPGEGPDQGQAFRDDGPPK